MDQELTKSNLEVTGNNLEEIVSGVDTSAQLVFFQKGVLASIQENLAENIAACETIRHALAVAVASDDSICYMVLEDDSGFRLSTSSSSIFQIEGQAAEAVIFDSMSQDSRYQEWRFLLPHPYKKGEYALANLRMITPTGGTRKELRFALLMSESSLCKAYSFLGSDSYIMSPDGVIISAVKKELIGSAADERVLQTLAPGDSGVEVLYQEKTGSVYSVYLSTIDCYLIVKSNARVLNTAKISVGYIAIATILLGAILSLMWSNYLAGNMTKPLVRLKGAMEKAHDGNLDVRCNPEKQDEIGYLCESFNQMMDNLNVYIAQLNDQQNLAKENEIRLLQSQINPHLLYNTLDSALYLMSNHRTEQSIQILEQLSAYFKLSLQRGNQIITVGAAIQHIEAYLKLQNLCRAKNFTLNVIGNPQLLQARILHMILQPVIENAVLHGFDGSFPDGSIEVALKKSAEDLVITVTDDGMGMSEEELIALRKSLDEPSPSNRGFGMWNIAKRIKMFYGQRYSLQVDSELGEYTRVQMVLPCQFDIDKENNNV